MANSRSALTVHAQRARPMVWSRHLSWRQRHALLAQPDRVTNLPAVDATGLAAVHEASRQRNLLLASTILSASLLLACPALAIDVFTETDLRNAINTARTTPNTEIILKNSITLSTDLPALQGTGTIIRSDTGQNYVINGASQYRGLFVYSGSTSVQNLTITNAVAQGGRGGDGTWAGGGGAGLGGALFVNSGATVTVSNVNLNGNAAGGGAGGSQIGGNGIGGGGGLGGNGGNGPGTSGGGGGGLGTGANGGSVVSGSGSPGIVSGAAGGGNSASPGFGGANGGGGGAGSGSGGGGGGVSGVNGIMANGGNGGFGGGGGGSSNLSGTGAGGFGGGANGLWLSGAIGGFGGGGSGAGGFGGGAGSGASGGGGGGGAGMGGAIFVVEGGTLNLQGNFSINGNTVTAGAGGSSAQAGSAFGSGIFLQGNGALTFNTGALDNQTVANAIADQTGSGGSGTYLTGGPICTPGVGCGSYSGSGSWGVSKSGAGTLIFSGANTYSGVTNVNAGRLQAGAANSFSTNSAHVVAAGTTLDLNDLNQTIGSLAGAGNVTLGTATLTAGGDNTSTTFSGVMSGVGGGFIKEGTGTTTLSGINTYSGATTINAGTLLVNGALTQSNTIVNAGGTFGGTGNVQGVSANGGVFAPGNGTVGSQMTVNGNVDFTGGGVYRVFVDPAAVSSAIVNGTANLNGGTVNAQFALGAYVARQYVIMQTAGLTGTYSGLTASNLPTGFAVSVINQGTNVVLQLNSPLANVTGLPTNQQNVIDTLNSYFNRGGTLPPGFVTLFGLSGDALLNGLSQASGEPGASVSTSTFMAWNSFFNMIFDPFAENRGGFGGGASAFAPTASAQSEEVRLAYAAVTSKGDLKSGLVTKAAPVAERFASRWSVWGGGYGGSAKTDGNAQIGSHNTTSRAYGFVAGADHRLTSDTLIGFALAGGGTSFGLDQGLGGGMSDMFQASVYARQNWGAAYLMGAFGYGWQDFTLKRTVTVAGTDKLEADFDAHTLAGRAEGGWRFGTPLAGMTPYAALQVVSLDLPSYTERAKSGADTFALSYGGRTDTQTRSEFGARFDYAMPMQTALLTLRGRAAWAHDYDNDRVANAGFLALPGTAFVVNGAIPDKDSLLLSAGAELALLNGFSLAGSFEGEFSGNTESYAGKGAVRYRW